MVLFALRACRSSTVRARVSAPLHNWHPVAGLVTDAGSVCAAVAAGVGAAPPSLQPICAGLTTADGDVNLVSRQLSLQ